MQAEKQDGVSVTLPFLVDYNANKHESSDLDHSKGVELINLISITATTSFSRTTFNGLNTLLGLAILSTPYALLSGGWLSLVLLIIIASATFYTGLLIKRCMHVDPNIRSYPDIGDKAFGTEGRLLVSVFTNLELYLLAAGFLILVGDNLHNLWPNVEVNIHGTIIIGGRQSFVLLVALVAMPTVWIKDVSTLSYISATGVVSSIVIIGSVLWAAIYDDIGFHHKGELLNWSGLPTALSLYTLCSCGHPVFPTLYSSMRNRKQFSWVLFLCFLLCTVTCAAMAVLGYLMFGSELQSQITLNFPTNKFSSRVAIYTALINPISKYALFLKPIVDAIESRFPSLCRRRFYRLFTRSMLLVSTVIVALILPFYGYLLSLVGAFMAVTAAILLPCSCYLKISGAHRKFGLELVMIGLIVLMGLVILVFWYLHSFGRHNPKPVDV